MRRQLDSLPRRHRQIPEGVREEFWLGPAGGGVNFGAPQSIRTGGTDWVGCAERGSIARIERLAAAGQQGAGSALFAATAALFERAQFPRNWTFPPKRGLGLLTESADELEVGDIWLLR